MKFYLISKFEKDGELVKSYLSKIGEISSSISDCDMIVSIGGDGTLLNSGKKAIEYNKPIVGINAGNLGYLCAFRIEDVSSLTLNDFTSLKESKRTLIEYNDNVAINDICILKAVPSQSIEVNVKNIGSWKGDGVIVATATGSTSYNQSAGGPILDPLSSDIVVTPVCPHFSKTGPQIIKGNEIEIEVPGRNTSVITADTQVLGEIKGTLIIKKSDKTLRLLKK